VYGVSAIVPAASVPTVNDLVRVRLVRKLAQHIDGIDLRSRRVGEVFEATLSEARLLIAEGWATVESENLLPPDRTVSSNTRLD
jgi:hypothetical protein